MTAFKSLLAGAIVVVLCAVPVPASRQGQPRTRPQGPATAVTVVTPIWTGFLSAPETEVAAAVAALRSRIGEGGALRVGFASYMLVNMNDWHVDISSPSAVHAALSGLTPRLDEGIRRARRYGIPLVITLLTAIRSLTDPVQLDSYAEDRRVMQWYEDNTVADGWWTHSRYARRQYAVQQAYMRAVARVFASRTAADPDTLVAISADGEVELAANLPQVADYSPFAIAEFRDWLRGAGLYAPGAPFARDAWVDAGRYRDDAGPHVDSNQDGHTLNGDYGTSFLSWDLRYFNWSLDDDPFADPAAIPEHVFSQPGFVQMPDSGREYFDAPRVMDPASPWWRLWNRFRQAMVWHHNRDLAEWMTTTPDDSGNTLSPGRFFSYQIPADYLFGGTPEEPNPRLYSSASPWWTANVAPFGGLGFTSFGVRFGTNTYLRTLPGFLSAIRACGPAASAWPQCVNHPLGLAGVRWGIFEWNPVVPLSSRDDESRVRARLRDGPSGGGFGGSRDQSEPADHAIYLDEIQRLRRYRPTVLAPFLWNDRTYGILDTGFETALRHFAALLRDGWDPPLRLDRSILHAAVSRTNGAVTSQTPAQVILVSQPSGGTVDWSVTADAAWLRLSPAAGHGDGTFTVSVPPDHARSLPAGTHQATITVSAPQSVDRFRTVDVRLEILDSGTAGLPFGSFDTPVSGARNLTGSFAVTGWALDDVGIDRVEIWRDLIEGEDTVPFYAPEHPAHGKVFIANASFVAGSRPDVEAAYPTVPLSYRAGWGYLLLSWGLWGQGNGTYTLYAYAFDQEGNPSLLGTRTIGVANALATKPFGALDTPVQGEITSGGFWNYGWALTPNSAPLCYVPERGVLMNIDSGPFFPVTYGDPRADISASFPGFSNGVNSGGAHYIDTTQYTNGVHQIGWLVTDSCNRQDGIGSRFFSILNGAAGHSTRVAHGKSAPGGAAVAQGPSPRVSLEPVAVRQLGGDWSWIWPSTGGARVVTVPQDGRIEIRLPASAGPYSGFQQSTTGRRTLPVGSSLDETSAIFYWQPAPGFLGAYDLVFYSQDVGEVRVRVVVGPRIRMAIDLPASGANVLGPFVVAGWALDLASEHGDGIDQVRVWARPVTGGPVVLLGSAANGDPRFDVAGLYGSAFTGSSYSLVVSKLPAGAHDLIVGAVRTGQSHPEAFLTVRINVR